MQNYLVSRWISIVDFLASFYQATAKKSIRNTKKLHKISEKYIKKVLDKSKENAYNKDNKTKERNKKQGGQSNEDIALHQK